MLARGRLARAAAMIATITVASRLVGFARTIVFGRAVGSGCVGSVYQTANTIPNIVFDLVAGGVLSALVVPLLAPYFANADRDAASRTVSALLTWTFVVLVPVTVVIAALAEPLVRLLLGPGGGCAGGLALGTRMLVVFAPQVLLYGVAVVVGGVLQSAERFAWPALAPLLSSLVVIAAYLWYGALAGTGRDTIGRTEELILSVGTTVGVFVLAACQVPALRGAQLLLRPTLRFPPGQLAPARQAALAGVLTLGTQQLSSAVMIRLANQNAPTGTVVVVTLAMTVYLLPWAVLAVPVATSGFPRLSASWEAGEHDDARQLMGMSTRVVIGLAALGTAALVAAAEPVANVLLSLNAPAHRAMAPTIAIFAIGLIGWSLVALLARALYAARRTLVAARAQVIGQLVVIGADIVLAVVVAGVWRAQMLALGNAIGVWLTVGLLLLAARRVGMLPSLRRVCGAVARGALAAAVGAGTGWAIGRLAEGVRALPSVPIGLAAGVAGALVAVALLALLDAELRSLVRARLR